MDSTFFIISTLLNNRYYARTLSNTEYLSYEIINAKFVTKHRLQRIKITPQKILGFNSRPKPNIDKITIVQINIDRYRYKKPIFLYVVPHIEGYDLLLGLL